MISDIIILAGGFGTRLWPASSAECPKQFMTISDGLSFLQLSMKRALAVNPSGKIVVVTRRDLISQCVNQCNDLAKKLPEELRDDFLRKVCVLAEPCAKQTAAAIMLATYFVGKASASGWASAGGGVSANAGDSAVANSSASAGASASAAARTILVLTSDHIIETDAQFAADCAKASAAAESGNFVCFVIPPTEASNAYGYIKTGSTISSAAGNGIYKIDHFEEKPDIVTAQNYLKEGNYWWNSGMFAFTSETLETEMKMHTPEIFAAFESVRKNAAPSCDSENGIAVCENWKAMEEAYAVVPSVAIDKAIAEKTSLAVAVRATFSWIDVGSWDTFSEVSKNTSEQKVAQVEARNNFVYSDIPVALCGVSNVVVVIKNGAALIMKKGESALMKNVVNQILDIER